MMDEEFSRWLNRVLENASRYEPCMSLVVNEDAKRVELCLDTSVPAYGEWIAGEGADICLLRCIESGAVVGCYLPLLSGKLAVFHSGPLRVNDGFLKEMTCKT